MTRLDYMEGKVTHAEYYRSIAKAAHISFAGSPMLPRIRVALTSGDEYLNTIGISYWDMLAYQNHLNLSKALRAHGDFYSLGSGVCVLKQAARDAAGIPWTL